MSSKKELEEQLETILAVFNKSLQVLDYAMKELISFIQKLPVQDQIDLKRSLSNFFDSMETSVREARYCLRSEYPDNSRKFII